MLEHGFRALFLEGDEAAGAELDALLLTGGDPAEVLAGARTFWRNQELLDVLRWVATTPSCTSGRSRPRTGSGRDHYLVRAAIRPRVSSRRSRGLAMERPVAVSIRRIR
jgi:hypothetical protein